MPLIQGWLCSIDVLKYIYYSFWMIFTSKSVVSFQSGIIWFGILNNKSFSVGNYVEHGICTFKSKLLNFMRNVLAKSADTLWLCVYLLFRKVNQKYFECYGSKKLLFLISYVLRQNYLHSVKKKKFQIISSFFYRWQILATLVGTIPGLISSKLSKTKYSKKAHLQWWMNSQIYEPNLS